MNRSLRIIAATIGLGAAVAVGTPTASAEDIPTVPWDQCGSWCLYGDYNFQPQIGAPSHGDLAFADWDQTSSIINNTEDWVCAYSYEENGDAQLVSSVGPQQAWSAGEYGTDDTNDMIDRIEVTPDLFGSGEDTCPDVLPGGVNPLWPGPYGV